MGAGLCNSYVVPVSETIPKLDKTYTLLFRYLFATYSLRSQPLLYLKITSQSSNESHPCANQVILPRGRSYQPRCD